MLAVEPMELAVDEGLQLLHGVFNLRRVEVAGQGANPVAQIGNEVCVFDHDLIGLVRP